MKPKRKTALKKKIMKKYAPEKISVPVYYGFNGNKVNLDIDSMTDEFERKLMKIEAEKKKYKWVK